MNSVTAAFGKQMESLSRQSTFDQYDFTGMCNIPDIINNFYQSRYNKTISVNLVNTVIKTRIIPNVYQHFRKK